jgi:suppressor for copper-sensitivity B
MIADWTVKKPEITDYLRSHGRVGIPYYQVIPGNRGEVIELPTVIFPEDIIKALQEALKSQRHS